MRYFLFLILLSGCATHGTGTRAFKDATLWYPAPVAASERVESAFLTNAVPDAPLPTDAHPLVLLSHGNGGNPASLSWLGELLARHGYLVAAPMHPGTNFKDVTPTETYSFWKRTTHLRNLLDELLADPEVGPLVDKKHIGMIGFSLGGSTTLAASGMEYEPRQFNETCVANDCKLLDGVKLREIRHSLAEPDARVSRFIAIAPAFGPGFHPRPNPNLLIIASESDEAVSFVTNAHAIAEIGKVKLLAVKNAGHYSFLTRCSPKIALPLCPDLGRPREQLHEEIAQPILDFLEENHGR